MERPDVIAAHTVGPRRLPAPEGMPCGGALADGIGARACAHAFIALIAFGLLGHAIASAIALAGNVPDEVRTQWKEALATLCGSVGMTAIIFHQLRRTAPATLHQRSEQGCAWYGASDAVVAHGFLLGGVVAFAQVLAVPAPGVIPTHAAAPPYAEWQLLPAMVFAFAVIAAAPVAEELMMRGLLFATLRTRWSTSTAALAVTFASTLLHYPQFGRHPPALVGLLVVGGLALWLRVRHASLAPAIALHCGHNSTLCVVMALG